MTNYREPCEFLEWDSEFFGYRIGRILRDHLDQKLIDSIIEWSALNQIDCLYFLAEADDIKTIRLAEDNNFRMVEIRTNYEWVLKNWNPEIKTRPTEKLLVRPVRSEDMNILQQISSYSYTDSRWYCDPCFPEEKCQLYFQKWIQKSAEEGDVCVLVAEIDGDILGYILGTRLKNKNEGAFELCAVRIDQRGQGIATELLISGLNWYVKAGIHRMTASTQGRNIKVQRTLLRQGFLLFSVQLYYHKWFTPCFEGDRA